MDVALDDTVNTHVSGSGLMYARLKAMGGLKTLKLDLEEDFKGQGTRQDDGATVNEGELNQLGVL